jgi:hypothetical protein
VGFVLNLLAYAMGLVMHGVCLSSAGLANDLQQTSDLPVICII